MVLIAHTTWPSFLTKWLIARTQTPHRMFIELEYSENFPAAVRVKVERQLQYQQFLSDLCQGQWHTPLRVDAPHHHPAKSLQANGWSSQLYDTSLSPNIR